MVLMYRQGDVLIVQIRNIPKRAKKINTDIVIKGEISGHAHRVISASIYASQEEIYIEANTFAAIIHEEHATIEIQPGKYEVIRQQEYVDPRIQRAKKIQYVFD